MSRFRPPEVLAFYASSLAAVTAALAPLYGQDPARMGAIGFSLGMLIGLPWCVAWTCAQRVSSRRRR